MLQRSDEGDDPRSGELKAAMQLVRRRKMGHFRGENVSPDRMRKDLAALARAGFSFDIAQQALGRPDSDDDFF